MSKIINPEKFPYSGTGPLAAATNVKNGIDIAGTAVGTSVDASGFTGTLDTGDTNIQLVSNKVDSLNVVIEDSAIKLDSGEFANINEANPQSHLIEVSIPQGAQGFHYPDGNIYIKNFGSVFYNTNNGSWIMPDGTIIAYVDLPAEWKVTPTTNRNPFKIASIPVGESALGAIEQNVTTKELRAVLGDSKVVGSGLAFDDPTGDGFTHTNNNANGIYVHPQVFNETLSIVAITGISSFYLDYNGDTDVQIRFGIYKMTTNDTIPDDSGGFPVPDAYTDWVDVPNYSQYKRDILNGTKYLFDNIVILAAGEGYCFLVEVNKTISYYSDKTTTTVTINGTNYYDCGFGANDFGMKIDGSGGGHWDGSLWNDRVGFKTMGAVITYILPPPSYPATINGYEQIAKAGTPTNPIIEGVSTKAILVTKDQMDGLVAMPTFDADEYPMATIFNDLQNQPLPRVEIGEPADPPEGGAVFWINSSGDVIIKKTVSSSTTDTTIA